jgi:hypothetical protein
MSGGVLMRSQEIEEMINYCARVPPAFSAKEGGRYALAKVGCEFNVYPALFTRNRNHISVGIHGKLSIYLKLSVMLSTLRGASV